MAAQACLHTISPKKRGPKFKQVVSHGEIILSLKQKVSELETEIERISQTTQTIPSTKYAKLVRPDRCPYFSNVNSFMLRLITIKISPILEKIYQPAELFL